MLGLPYVQGTSDILARLFKSHSVNMLSEAVQYNEVHACSSHGQDPEGKTMW